MSCCRVPTAVFRFDASATIGAGHAVRSLALASELGRRGWACVAAAKPETFTAIPGGLPPGIAMLPLDCPEDRESEAIRAAHQPGLVVVDHYGRGEAFELEARQGDTLVVVIDDAPARRHMADLLVDQTPGRSAEEWRPHVSGRPLILAGAEYALLRPNFAAARTTRPPRTVPRDPLRILISLGATDPTNMLPLVLAGLERVDAPLAADILIGSRAPHMDAVRRVAASSLRHAVSLHVDLADPSPLIAEADLAIGAGGVSCLERCCLGIPSILLTLAANQADNIAALTRLGAGSPVACDAGAIARAVIGMAAPATYAEMAAAAARVCDGNGTGRVADALETLLQNRSR